MLGGGTTTVGSGSTFGTITSAFFFVGVRYPNIFIIFAGCQNPATLNCKQTFGLSVSSSSVSQAPPDAQRLRFLMQSTNLTSSSRNALINLNNKIRQ
jgi:hypothetical protein